MRLSGKGAIVTGGASGIGREIVSVFKEQGCRVVVADLREDPAKEFAREADPAGETLFPFAMDVSVRAQVHAMVAFGLDRLGRIDILVNCAGITELVPFEQITEEQ